MDIETATRQALAVLTFDERPIAQDLLNAQQTAKLQKRVWLRAPTFTLATAISQARSLAKAEGFTAKFINIYCDTLIVGKDVVNPEADPSGSEPFIVLELFVRKIESAVPGQYNSLTMNMTSRSELVLWTPFIPSSFTLNLKLPNKTAPGFVPRVDAGNFGISYQCAGSELKTEQYEAPDIEVKTFDYLSLIQEDGTVKDMGIVSDHIARLLQFQFIIAQSCMNTNRQLAVDILAYVIAATNTPYSALLNYQACSLWSSLTLKADISTVSSVNVYSSKQILKARLLAALSYEQAFREFSLATNGSKIQADFALNLLAKSDDAMETYKFLVDIRQREYDNALTANSKAAATFKKNQSDIERLQKAFESGIESYKHDKEMEAAKSIVKAVIGAAIAIGAIVATAGLAAPLAVPAAAGAVSAASKIATLIARLKDVFTRLKAIYEKLKPVLEKIQEVVKTVAEVVAAVKTFQSVTAGPKTLKPNVESTDIYNVTAEWKNFDITVREMEDSLREYDIAGKREYFHSLKTLVNNGQAYILAQANFVQRGDELATTLLQRKMEDRDHGRLTKLSANIGNNSAVLGLLKRAMFDRLLSIRFLVFLDFHTYSIAYNYHTLRNGKVVTLSPLKPVVDYLDDAAKLQGAVVSFGSTTRIQSRWFTTHTLCGYESVQELGSALAAGNKATFTVNPQDRIWQGFNRIRMSSARCYLDGLKWTSASDQPRSIRLVLKTDGRFFDIDTVARSTLLPIPNTEANGSSPDVNGISPTAANTSPTDLVPVTRAFVGDPRALLFEYVPDSGVILCDGQWGQLRDYTKHTPMTNWEVGIEAPSDDLAKLDFSAFSGIRMEFECEVIWKGL